MIIQESYVIHAQAITSKEKPHRFVSIDPRDFYPTHESIQTTDTFTLEEANRIIKEWEPMANQEKWKIKKVSITLTDVES